MTSGTSQLKEYELSWRSGFPCRGEATWWLGSPSRNTRSSPRGRSRSIQTGWSFHRRRTSGSRLRGFDVALHLHPFVLLTVRDVEDQPGFQEKMTMFVESPQLAIRALAFVQDDGGQFGLRVMTNLLEDSMSYGEVAWFFIICPWVWVFNNNWFWAQNERVYAIIV